MAKQHHHPRRALIDLVYDLPEGRQHRRGLEIIGQLRRLEHRQRVEHLAEVLEIRESRKRTEQHLNALYGLMVKMAETCATNNIDVLAPQFATLSRLHHEFQAPVRSRAEIQAELTQSLQRALVAGGCA